MKDDIKEDMRTIANYFGYSSFEKFKVRERSREDKGTIGKALLDVLEKLQEENEKLKKLIIHKNEYTQQLEQDLFENCNNYVIPKQRVKDKIEELKHTDFIAQQVVMQHDKEALAIMEVLQELLEEG